MHRFKHEFDRLAIMKIHEARISDTAWFKKLREETLCPVRRKGKIDDVDSWWDGLGEEPQNGLLVDTLQAMAAREIFLLVSRSMDQEEFVRRVLPVDLEGTP